MWQPAFRVNYYIVPSKKADDKIEQMIIILICCDLCQICSDFSERSEDSSFADMGARKRAKIKTNHQQIALAPQDKA